MFVGAAAFLGKLCLALAPVALLFLFGYSFTKRFTFLCHLFLGLAIAGGPGGAWIAVRGDFGLAPAFLMVAVATWIGGFDILYAIADAEFDRARRPAFDPRALRRPRALGSRPCSTASPAESSRSGRRSPGAVPTGIAVVIGSWSGSTPSSARRSLRLNVAFFNLNGYVSVVFFLGTLIDVWCADAGRACRGLATHAALIDARARAVRGDRRHTVRFVLSDGASPSRTTTGADGGGCSSRSAARRSTAGWRSAGCAETSRTFAGSRPAHGPHRAGTRHASGQRQENCRAAGRRSIDGSVRLGASGLDEAAARRARPARRAGAVGGATASGGIARGWRTSNAGRWLGSQVGPKPLASKGCDRRPRRPCATASISTWCWPARDGEQYDSR